MQLMGDALTVLGSRLGIVWDPANERSFLVRHGNHPGIPLKIYAGVKIRDRELVLPLTDKGERFEFMDQDMTAATMSMSGIDPGTGIHVKLKITIPFRPRDTEFSTVPVIYMDLSVDRLPSSFRWIAQNDEVVTGTIALGIAGEGFQLNEQTDGIHVTYLSTIHRPFENDFNRKEIRFHDDQIDCSDRLALLSGDWVNQRLEGSFQLRKGEQGVKLALAWCAYDKPLLTVLGKRSPFKYTEQFNGVDDVVAWAKVHVDEVADNAEKVDRILTNHSLGEAVSKLMAQTLHAWLVNTWWVVRDNGQDWFSVWEGNCYFHSTVDVEYTQGPFYLAFWPELLELELNEWPFFGKNGEQTLGERGRGTLYLSHDMGVGGNSDRQFYHHDMEVEESTNFLILAYAHYKRTGKDETLLRHTHFIQKLMDFIVLCDTTGNGIPDKGCANTIDDASPAVQYGSEQIYLAVKALAAIQAGVHMLRIAGLTELATYEQFAANALATIESQGWLDDHYAVTLTRTKDGTIDPWTGEPQTGDLAGWDAYHIYTENGLALLDMVGHDTGLIKARLVKDLITATQQTEGRYGSRHTSYIDMKADALFIPGLASHSRKVGWISMNMLRDIAAAYRGVDLLSHAQKYWSWQCTTNTQQVALFFETFYGNNLSFYPRGVAVFGYFDAAAGMVFDAVSGTQTFAPINGSLKAPLLLFADWKAGTVPTLISQLKEGRITYEVN